MSLWTLTKDKPRYPARLGDRLRNEAPERVTAVGRGDLLALSKTALFCSAHCPGSVILAAHDQAARWRDEGRCIIGGFHSPVEKDCLRILLRGRQPIIICSARGLERMRVPGELKGAMKEGRLLLLSPFTSSDRRITKELAGQRNRFVAALADEIVFVYVAPGGRLDQLRESVAAWGVTLRCLAEDSDKSLTEGQKLLSD